MITFHEKKAVRISALNVRVNNKCAAERNEDGSPTLWIMMPSFLRFVDVSMCFYFYCYVYAAAKSES